MANKAKGPVDPADSDLLNRRSTLEWKLDQGTAWRQGSLSPVTGLTPPPLQPELGSTLPGLSSAPSPPRPNSARRSANEKKRVQPSRTVDASPSPEAQSALAASEPPKMHDTVPLPKRESRLVWKNGMDVSDEFRDYAERVARGEDLPPFRGNFLAEPVPLIPAGMSSTPMSAPSEPVRLPSGARVSPLLSPLPPGVELDQSAEAKAARSRSVAQQAQASSGGLLTLLAISTAAAASLAFVLWSPTTRVQNPIASLTHLGGDPVQLAERNPDGTRVTPESGSAAAASSLPSSLRVQAPKPAADHAIASASATPKTKLAKSAAHQPAVSQAIPAITPKPVASAPKPRPRATLTPKRAVVRPKPVSSPRAVAKPQPVASAPRRSSPIVLELDPFSRELPSRTSGDKPAQVDSGDLLLEDSPF